MHIILYNCSILYSKRTYLVHFKWLARLCVWSEPERSSPLMKAIECQTSLWRHSWLSSSRSSIFFLHDSFDRSFRLSMTKRRGQKSKLSLESPSCSTVLNDSMHQTALLLTDTANGAVREAACACVLYCLISWSFKCCRNKLQLPNTLQSFLYGTRTLHTCRLRHFSVAWL